VALNVQSVISRGVGYGAHARARQGWIGDAGTGAQVHEAIAVLSTPALAAMMLTMSPDATASATVEPVAAIALAVDSLASTTLAPDTDASQTVERDTEAEQEFEP
jgi:hypothetical protein